MKRKAFDLTIFFLLLICVFLLHNMRLFPDYINNNNIYKIAEGSKKLNINNLVVYVYLGSRLLDSLIESMVIVAGAFSLSYLWRKDD
ncbi:MAG: hypothetical protein C0601_06430 [Candidatus Muiribacterium halophilum]|uniref:Uncharacterized protein n=1 Tax=Muiribacterium halophilum TaxID=2053465 RepID=A0A2N5ZG80_MUIH1|nr:MAG: hypothetical protein C0601_06430 [Candidatus Muirbacterium halophilum]